MPVKLTGVEIFGGKFFKKMDVSLPFLWAILLPCKHTILKFLNIFCLGPRPCMYQRKPADCARLYCLMYHHQRLPCWNINIKNLKLNLKSWKILLELISIENHSFRVMLMDVILEENVSLESPIGCFSILFPRIWLRSIVLYVHNWPKITGHK